MGAGGGTQQTFAGRPFCGPCLPTENVVVQSISYHPGDHIVCFAGTGHHPQDGSPAPVSVYRADKKKPRKLERADTDPNVGKSDHGESLLPVPSTAPVLLTASGNGEFWKETMPEEEKQRWSMSSLDMSTAENNDSEKFKNMLEKLDKLIVKQHLDSD